MAKQKTLLELIENLTWFNDVEKSKEIFRRLLLNTPDGKRQDINLGIVLTDVTTAFNALENFKVQHQKEGLRIVRTIIDGQLVDYLFTGIGGLYGVECELEATDADFSEFNIDNVAEVIEQNNTFKLVTVDTLDSTNFEAVAVAINALPQFTVGDTEIIVIKSSTINYGELSPSITEGTYVLNNRGKGTYGVGGTILTDTDIIFITKTDTLVSVDELASTQFISLGNVGTASIVSAFNSHTFIGLETPVQEQTEGYVLIDVIINNTPLEYLFVGTGGTYGVGGIETAVEEDFILLTDILLDASTQFIEVGELGLNSIEEAFNLMTPCVTVQAQTAGYVIANSTVDGTPVQFLFVGTGGSYGSGCVDTAIADDFVIFQPIVEPTDENQTWTKADQWYGNTGIVSTANTGNIIHNGVITATGLRLPVNMQGTTHGINSVGYGVLPIRANYGLDFLTGNVNHGRFRFFQDSPASFGSNAIDYNIINQRNYSSAQVADNYTASPMVINGNVNLSNQTNSRYIGLHINPTFSGTGYSRFAIVAENGDVDIKTGNLKLGKYGDGIVTGTATYALGVDIDGNVIETALGGGGGGNVIDDLQATTTAGNTTTNNIIISKTGVLTPYFDSTLLVRHKPSQNDSPGSVFSTLRDTVNGSTGSTSNIVSRITNSTSVPVSYSLAFDNGNTYSGSGGGISITGIRNNITHSGSGNMDWLLGNSSTMSIIGTGTGLTDYARNESPSVIIDNPNITVNYAQASHPNLTFNKGNIGQGQVLFLDLDVATANLGTTLQVNGDVSYIQGGAGTDVAALKTHLSNKGAKGRFIWQQGTWESDFNGIINVLNPVADIDNATNKVLVTKEWVQNQSYSGGAFIPLAGTAVGSPVTGNIVTNSYDALSAVDTAINIGVAESIAIGDAERFARVGFASIPAIDLEEAYSFAFLGAATATNGASLTIWANPNTSDAFGLKVDAPSTSYGLKGGQYYGANYDDNTYVQKKYIDDNFGLPTGLEAINETNGIGWRLIGRDPLNFGNIGQGAIDFGASSGVSTTRGATGQYSFNHGEDNVASAYGSISMGASLTNTGQLSVLFGQLNTNDTYTTLVSGYDVQVTGGINRGYNFSTGRGNRVIGGFGNSLIGTSLTQTNGVGVTVLGHGNEAVTTVNDTSTLENPILIVGNGTHAILPNGDWTVATRSNALVIKNNGVITANSLSIAEIDAEATGKVLLTREWVTTQGYSTSSGAFQTLDEGNGLGIVRTGRVATNYGNVGLDAFDASFSDIGDQPYGATGNRSVAIGFKNRASNLDSVAIGELNTVSGDSALAFGLTNTVSGGQSIAFGTSNTITNIFNYAFGASNTLGGQQQCAFGHSNSAGNLSYSCLFGVNNVVNSNTSGIALGNGNTVDGNYAMGYGIGTTTQSMHETQMGSYPTTYVEATNGEFTWNLTDRLFTIGNGQSSGTKSDAFTILKNGNTGIGINNFQSATTGEKLEVNGTVKATSFLGVSPIETASTGTIISLSTSGGNYCNMGAANATTTYTTTGAVLGGKAKVLINTTSQPTITGGTLISGATWVTGVNMYMIVEYLGTVRGVEYFFLEI